MFRWRVALISSHSGSRPLEDIPNLEVPLGRCAPRGFVSPRTCVLTMYLRVQCSTAHSCNLFVFPSPWLSDTVAESLEMGPSAVSW